MREFEWHDYHTYAGAEPFTDGSEPMIHTLESGLDIIADGSGVTLNGTVGTMSVAFILYEARWESKQAVESAAKDWIEELEDLAKHEQIALLHHIGLKIIAG